MSEIRLKRLPIQFEQEILKYHMKCQSESEAKTNLDIVDKVTLYQTCMDYYISSICRIQIIQQ